MKWHRYGTAHTPISGRSAVGSSIDSWNSASHSSRGAANSTLYLLSPSSACRVSPLSESSGGVPSSPPPPIGALPPAPPPPAPPAPTTAPAPETCPPWPCLCSCRWVGGSSEWLVEGDSLALRDFFFLVFPEEWP